MRICSVPYYAGVDRGDGGIRRVCEAQVRYLPDFGIGVTPNPDEADLIANHGVMCEERPGVPMVSHNHGMYWHDYDWPDWSYDANRHVIKSLVHADAITAPSHWVANAITRGMLAQPTVIHHGIDADEWAFLGDHKGYVLWNKARKDAVSDPNDMQRLAAKLPDVKFVSTFGHLMPNVLICGSMTMDEMKPIIQHAALYLATARETFGIGTLEALAAGVPVVGWRYGGQEEIIIQGETGYLADYGDYDALAAFTQQALSERDRLRANAVADVRERWRWQDKIAQYADLYRRVYGAYRQPRPKVSVIVTCHNLARYLEPCLSSVAQQTMRDWECLIVDDESSDETPDVAQAWSRRESQFSYLAWSWRESQFSYLRTPTNLKLSGARNYGFAHCRGRYVIFLDADDMLTHNALDRLSMALDTDPGIHIAYGHLDIISDDGSNQQRNPWPPAEYSWQQQIAHLNQMPYAAMMRREVLERSGGYRTRDWRAEDAALWARLTSFGFRAKKVTEESCLIYRIRSDSKGAAERQKHADNDGIWTAWLPFALAGTAEDGVRVTREQARVNERLVPFGAQGTPPVPMRSWLVRHHQHPAISVIIPVGPGHDRFITDALDSLIAQSIPHWEAVVVNDTTNPLVLAAHPYARIVESGGRGAGAARNVGIAAARAPLLVFLDADDYLHPKALELLLRAYLENDGRYVYSDWVLRKIGMEWDSEPEVHTVPDYDATAWLQGAQHPVTVLIEKTQVERIGGFDEQMTFWEDWDFQVKCAVNGICGVRAPFPLIIYREHSGMRRQQTKDAQREMYAMIQDRYAAKREEVANVGCSGCGGNTTAHAAAQGVVEDMAKSAFERIVANLTAPPASTTNGAPQAIVMEFVGEQFGAQVWFSKDGQRKYNGGREPQARYAQVDPRDVEYLESLGRWRRVR